MSIFLNQNSLTPPQAVSEEKMKLAELHYDAMQTTLITMQNACLKKCVPDDEGYPESELNKGESTCIDRCVKKFMAANRMVGEYAQFVRFDATSLKHYENMKRKYLDQL